MALHYVPNFKLFSLIKSITVEQEYLSTGGMFLDIVSAGVYFRTINDQFF